MSKPVPFSTTLEVRDGCLCLYTQRAARVLSRHFDDVLRPFGLTNGQFSLLMALNRPEPPTLKPVAQLLGMDRTTLTAALKPLERAGWVQIEKDAADKRNRRLRLTEDGEKKLAEAVPVWRSTHAAIEARLSVNADALRLALTEIASL